MHRSGEKNYIKNELSDIDKEVNRGVVSDTNLFRRLELQLFDNGLWCTDPGKVKEAFFNHFDAQFKKPVAPRFMLNFPFNKQLSDMQAADLERNVSRDEIRLAIWNYRENKSPNLGWAFYLNEILHWCKRKKKQAMLFKVDFAKAYDSVRWDYLLDVLEAFEFGQTWCKWIGVDEGLFKGVHLQGSISISRLFYADDAMFIGEWCSVCVRLEREIT
nr:RNA-directed DNA polymerase, eukaryota, reverse transcriptase zinc-binding domain protein [Tanacetum cinerariifolium]